MGIEGMVGQTNLPDESVRLKPSMITIEPRISWSSLRQWLYKFQYPRVLGFAPSQTRWEEPANYCNVDLEIWVTSYFTPCNQCLRTGTRINEDWGNPDGRQTAKRGDQASEDPDEGDPAD